MRRRKDFAVALAAVLVITVIGALPVVRRPTTHQSTQPRKPCTLVPTALVVAA